MAEPAPVASDLSDLSAGQIEGISRLRVAGVQEDFGGTFAQSVEEWRAAPRGRLLGIGFLIGQEPIGLVLLKRPPASPEWTPPQAMSLHGFKIAEAWQGRGFGTAALRLAVDLARRTWPDADALVLAVDAGNAPALSILCVRSHRVEGWFQGMQVLHTNEAEGSPFGVPVEDIEVLTSAEPDVEVFKALYAACARRSAQVVEYQSRDEFFTMAFSPHAIVTAPGRLHFRGYADYTRLGTGAYIDVVPSRVRRIDGERSDLAVSSAGDIEWATRVDLRFRLNPDLPESLKVIVLEEWAGRVTSEGENLVLTVPAVRQALTLYVRRGLRHRVFRSMAHEVWLPLSVDKDEEAPSA